MIQISRCLRLPINSVPQRLVAKYGKSAEHSPNGNWETRDAWFGAVGNPADEIERRMELRHFLYQSGKSPLVDYPKTAKEYAMKENIIGKYIVVFIGFVLWRKYEMMLIYSDIESLPKGLSGIPDHHPDHHFMQLCCHPMVM